MAMSDHRMGQPRGTSFSHNAENMSVAPFKWSSASGFEWRPSATGLASLLNPLTNCGCFEIIFSDRIDMVTYIVLLV